MSTLADLRETLERHAEELHDGNRPVRAGDVRRRVRVARRRRAAATAVAAAVVVTGSIGAASWLQAPRAPEVAGPSVVGVAVPDEIAIHGFPYALADRDGVEGADDRLRLPGSDERRAVSLVGNGLGSGSATLFVDGSAVARVFAGRPVAVPVPVAASDADAVLEVELHDTPAGARTGVAVYDATGELAPGTDDGTAVFRDTVAGARLLEADFSARGEASAALSFETPLSTTITSFCRTEEPGLWVQVLLDGGEMSSRGRCGTDPDPDAYGASFSGGGTASGPHTVEVRVTRGQRGEVVSDAAVELGVAAYQSVPAVRVAGAEVAQVVEHMGRTWRLDVRDVGAALGIRAETDLLVGFVAEGGPVRATWRGDLTSGSTSSVETIGRGPGVMVEGLLLAGDTYDVRLASEDGAAVDGALLIYRPE